MNKIFLSLASVLAVVLMITAGFPVARAEEPTAEIEVEVSPSAEAEVEAEPTGILPTNPFYFIKKFGWGLRRVFTFNPVKKVELELRIADQQAAEIKELSRVNQDEESIVKAAENYEDNILKLKAKLEALKEKSENPKVDILLDKVVERSLKHQELFDELKDKHQEIRAELEKAKSSIDEVVAQVSEQEADSEKFNDRLDRALEKENTQAVIQGIRKAEILERIEGKVEDDALSEKLTMIKDMLIKDMLSKDILSKDMLSKDIVSKDIMIKDDVAGAATLQVKREAQSPSTNVNTYFGELLTSFDIESASITEDYARLLIEIARKIINYGNINIARVESSTDEIPTAVLARARELLTEAERALTSDINLAWNKLKEVAAALRILHYPSQSGTDKLPTVNPAPISPKTSEPGTSAAAPDKFITGARMQIDTLRRAIAQCRVSGSSTGGPQPEPVLQDDVAALNCDVASSVEQRLLGPAENLLAEAERAKQAGDVNLAVNKAKEAWGIANRGISLIYQDPTDYLKQPPSATLIRPTPVAVTPTPAVVRPTPVIDVVDVITEPIVPSEVRVIYTGSFDPQVVQIKKGGTVTFVNSSNLAFWPASGPHPTHEVYPESGGCISSAFDACRGLRQGESFSFTFDKAGTWHYHDHLNPSVVGTVEVVE